MNQLSPLFVCQLSVYVVSGQMKRLLRPISSGRSHCAASPFQLTHRLLRFDARPFGSSRIVNVANLDDGEDTVKHCSPYFFPNIFFPLPARAMSVLRATPPFRRQSDGVELIGQDSDLWTSERGEGPPPPQSHDDEDLQPIRKEQLDHEVRMRYRGCTCVLWRKYIYIYNYIYINH